MVNVTPAGPSSTIASGARRHQPVPTSLEQLTDPSRHAPAEPSQQGPAARLGRAAPPRVAARRRAPGRRRRRGSGSATTSRRPPSPVGDAAAHGHIEDLLGQLGHAVHDRRAARHDDARRRHVLEPRARQVPRHQREDLLDARLDDLRQDWRESWRGFRPPTDGTSTVSSSRTSAVSAQPCAS